MSTAWQVHAGIWRHAVLAERRWAVLGWSGVALALCVLAGFVMAFQRQHAPQLAPYSGLAISAAPLAALAMFLWLRYVSGAVRQNSPANAQLVPGLCHSVRRTTVVAWCLTLLPMAMLASGMQYLALAFLALCAMVTTLGMARGGRTIGTVMYILLILASLQVSSNPGLKLWMSQPPVLVVVAMLTMALGWDALRSVFPHGGERHWKLLRAQDKERVSTDPEGNLLHRRSSGHWRLLYAALLKNDLRPGARPEHLLLHALGPGNHRFDFVFPLVTVAVLALGLKLVLAFYFPAAGAIRMDSVFGFIGPLLFMQGFTVQRMVVSMNTTRGELSLVRLAPRAPTAGRLGRSVARQMLTISLTEWFVCAAAVLGVWLLFGGDLKGVMLLGGAMCTGLAMAGWALRDDSGKRPGSLAVVIVQTVAMGAGCIGLMVLSGRPLAWGALFVVVLFASIAIVWGRWNTMLNAPVPFPAGRLS